MEWFVFGMFVVITVLLLSGRGSWLIAGYNTMSRAKKSQIDEKKLCRRVGVMMLFVDVTLLITNVIMSTRFGIEHESIVGLSALAVIIIVVGFGIAFVNIGIKKE